MFFLFVLALHSCVLVRLIAKLFYFSFQQNMATYQNLITQSMYDKQLDSGKGTLLHLCDDVIQQEVKVPACMNLSLIHMCVRMPLE